jgi:hypothetical protein
MASENGCWLKLLVDGRVIFFEVWWPLTMLEAPLCPQAKLRTGPVEDRCRGLPPGKR